LSLSAQNERRRQDGHEQGHDRVGVEGEPRFYAQTEHHEDSEQQLGDAEQQDRSGRTGEIDGVQSRSQRDADQEAGQDHGEDVGRVVRARRAQPGPQGLVAQRGQARHERHCEGQSRPGGAVGKDAGLALDRPRSGGLAGLSALTRAEWPDDARLGPPAAEQEGADAGRRRAQCAELERLAEPEDLDEDEAGEQGADDGTERVHRVQAAELGAELAVISNEVPREGGQGGAHHDRRRCEGQDGEREADHGQHLRGGLEVLERSAVDLAQRDECERCQEHQPDEKQLEDAVESEWASDAVRQPPADDTADRHAREEARQDRRDCLCRVAEDEHQLSGPDNLVDEPGDPRQKEDEQHDSATGEVHRCSYWTGVTVRDGSGQRQF
jgi:hypothetical protein